MCFSKIEHSNSVVLCATVTDNLHISKTYRKKMHVDVAQTILESFISHKYLNKLFVSELKERFTDFKKF